MPILKLIVLSLFVLSGSSLSFGQARANPNLYFSKIVLPISSHNCRAQITSDDISPKKKSCIFDRHLEIGSEVRLIKERREGQWKRITLTTYENETFTIDIDFSSGNYKELIEMVLSTTPHVDSRSGCDAKTKIEIIRQIGFPSSIERDREGEIWRYDLAHVSSLAGDICGFDASTVQIKKDGSVTISGIV